MIFHHDLKTYRRQFETDGYIHIRSILSGAFMRYLADFHQSSASGGVGEHLPGQIPGKKRQYLFDFPSRGAALEFREQMAAVTGIEIDRLTLSERHLKRYDDQAPPFPAPHKDRGASRISVGLPIVLGPETSLCLFPKLDRSVNERTSAVYLDGPEGLDPLAAYQSGEPVFLHEAVGDMIVFEGSSLFHERTRPAGTAIVYLKLNGDGQDPLGENIYADVMPLAASPAGAAAVVLGGGTA